MNSLAGNFVQGVIVPDAKRAEIADRPMPPEHAPLRGLAGLVGGGADISWLHVFGADNQGASPTCVWQDCLDITEIAWRMKGKSVPNLRSVSGYNLAREKFHPGESGGGLWMPEGYWAARETGLWPDGAKDNEISGEKVVLAMQRQPVLEVLAVTAAWQPGYANRATGYLDPCVVPDIVGYHAVVLAGVLHAPSDRYFAYHIHWGQNFGFRGTVLLHETRRAKYLIRTDEIIFPANYEQHDGWRMHVN